MFDQLARRPSIVTTHWQTLYKHDRRLTADTETSRPALRSRDFRLEKSSLLRASPATETETLYFDGGDGGNATQRDLQS